jgi:hypothetical protein
MKKKIILIGVIFLLISSLIIPVSAIKSTEPESGWERVSSALVQMKYGEGKIDANFRGFRFMRGGSFFDPWGSVMLFFKGVVTEGEVNIYLASGDVWSGIIDDITHYRTLTKGDEIKAALMVGIYHPQKWIDIGPVTLRYLESWVGLFYPLTLYILDK